MTRNEESVKDPLSSFMRISVSRAVDFRNSPSQLNSHSNSQFNPIKEFVVGFHSRKKGGKKRPEEKLERENRAKKQTNLEWEIYSNFYFSIFCVRSFASLSLLPTSTLSQSFSALLALLYCVGGWMGCELKYFPPSLSCFSHSLPHPHCVFISHLTSNVVVGRKIFHWEEEERMGKWKIEEQNRMKL